MEEIKYKSIDFSKLKELDVRSEENQVFIGKNIKKKCVFFYV